jgi:hypothetical protein
MPDRPTSRQLAGWVKLVCALAILGIIWLVVLPFIGQLPAVAQHIEDQQRRNIDPSAMYYSELEIMPAIAHRVERLQETHGQNFWSVMPGE